MAMPDVEVVDGRLVFVIPLGFVDAQPLFCECSICDRRLSYRSPSWRMWEPEVECVWRVKGRSGRKRSGTVRPSAA